MKSIVCSSVKGGTGKTKVTAGIGKALARMGKQVALADYDYFAPNLDVELHTDGAELGGDGFGKIIPAKTQEGIEFVSLGLIYLQDQAVLVSEEDAIRDILQLQSQIRWDSPDYLIIDTAPTSSAVIQTSLRAPNLLGTVIVTQPSRVSRADLLRSFSLMKDKRIPILGVVINQAYYVCSQCGYQEQIYDLNSNNIEKLCDDWGVPVLGVVPHSQNLDGHFDDLANKIIKGTPVVLPEEKKPSEVPVRLVSWLKKIMSKK